MTPEPRWDLRLPLLAVTSWSSALVMTLATPGMRIPMMTVIAAGLLAIVKIRAGARRTVLVVALLWFSVAIGVVLRGEVVEGSWVTALAKQHAHARLVVEVRSDPKVRPGLNEDRAIVQAVVIHVEALGRSSNSRLRVALVLDAPAARELQVGARYFVSARLATSAFPGTAATASVREVPVLVRGPAWVQRWAGRIRDSIQDAAAGQTHAAGLVPALVDGDERTLPSELQGDFQAAGLSHLLAVSGTNFVLLGSAWLACARRIGVRGRAIVPVGLVGIVGLAVLARAEPSVIRAAIMGGVALVGLGQGQRTQGIRALSACVCLVMLWAPDLSTSPGFALSALATGGILLLAGGWRDALAAWMPRILAEAIAVTLAAYIACLPLIVALSGRLSLAAIPANLAAGVVVGPTTVLGFLGGVLALAMPEAGRLVAAPATWCASWISAVAHTVAGLPHSDIGVGSGLASLVMLVVVCGVLAMSLQTLLRRPIIAVPLLTTSLLASVVSLPGQGWPPPGWVMVACDVGQGDALVVRLAPGRALVVDAGPNPSAMRRCLRDLHVTTVPILVLSHFHADHVNGLAGALGSARVGLIEVTDFAEPPPRAAFVERLAAAAHVPIRVAPVGEQVRDGDARWQVIAPLAAPPADSESPPNDASVVILVEVRGVRILLSGDEETGSQELLAQTYPSLKVDVLKVAHHGSAKQDPELLASLGARHAIISAGRGNSYGLPKAATLLLLQRVGMQVHRTDLEGSQAVVVDGAGTVRVLAQR